MSRLPIQIAFPFSTVYIDFSMLTSSPLQYQIKVWKVLNLAWKEELKEKTHTQKHTHTMVAEEDSE